MDKKYLLKLAILFCGNVCAAFGVFLCMASGKGVDPITVILDGLMSTFHLSVGMAVIIFNGTLMCICYMLDKKSVKLGTVFSILTFSLSLNLLIEYGMIFITVNHILVSWMMLLAGIVFMGIRFSIGIFANIGCNTADIALHILSSKSKLNIKICKWILDLCYTIIGIALGGKFGVGTILCVLLVGMVYSCTLKILEKTSVTLKKANKVSGQESYVLVNENL